MIGSAASVNIARLMTKFNLKIEVLPDDLKCAECKSVLKDPYQVACGCRYCRTCIDKVMANGSQFCSGISSECGETPLSISVPDFRADKSISRLRAKCPQVGCSHECELSDMGSHLLVCQRKNVDRSFREVGSQHDKLATEEIIGHLQQENRGPIEVLIKTVGAINKDIEMLKCELVLKDEQITMIMDEMRHLENENKSVKAVIDVIKDENKWIEREKEILSGQVVELSKKLDLEVAKRHQSVEQESDRVTTIKTVIESNLDALETSMEPVKDHIRSINIDIMLIKSDIDLIKLQLPSPQVTMEFEHADASLDKWLIDDDVSKKNWGWSWLFGILNSSDDLKKSDTFTGATRPYTYQLISGNGVYRGELCVFLVIFAHMNDSHLGWPFRGAVTVIVADRDKLELCSSLTQQCQINRPANYHSTRSVPFVFRHSELKAAGIDLGRGLCVSCHIVPGA